MPRLRIILFTLLLLTLSTLSFGKSNEDIFTRAQKAAAAGKYDEALKDLNTALEKWKNHPHNYQVVLLTRARTYYKKGDRSAALKDLSDVLKTKNLEKEIEAQAYVLKGLLSRKGEGENQALADFTNAILVDQPDKSIRSIAYANRAVTFMNVGKPASAIADFDKSIEMDPTNAFAYAGRALLRLNSDQIEAAQTDAEKALKLEPTADSTQAAKTVLDELNVTTTRDKVVAPIGESGHAYVQVSFKRRGKPHRFLVDTGATYSLVSPQLFAEIRKETEVQRIGSAQVRTADGVSRTVGKYKVQNAYLYTLPLGEFEFHVLEDSGPRKADLTNLLGVRGFDTVTMTLDHGAKQVVFRKK